MRDTATGCSSKPSQDVTACITDVCSASLYNWHAVFCSGQLRATQATLYIRVSFYHGAVSRGGAPAYRVDLGLGFLPHQNKRRRSVVLWWPEHNNKQRSVRRNNNDKIYLRTAFCIMSSVSNLSSLRGSLPRCPCTICSLSDWNYLYKVRLATENNNLDVDIVDRMRVGCEYGNVWGCWLWWWLHCAIMIVASH